MARPVDHVDIGDGVAIAPEQCGQEAVQGIEIRQREERLAPEHLQPTAAVARAVAQDRAAYAVGDARLHFLPGARAAPDALTCDEPDLRPALLECLQQSRNERGIVLSIPIER